ncbi:unnamed protein product [Phaeothamnion confervicola]
MRIELRGTYPPLQSLALYGFDNVVEPFRETTMTVVGGGDTRDDSSNFEWTVYTEDGDAEARYTGRKAFHIFNRAAHTYRISVEELDAAGAIVDTTSAAATCKYIRRDTHRMNDEDRERTLAAMRLMFDVSGDDGRVLYGPKYISFEELTVLHLDRFTQIKCTPYHAGAVFLTAHAAMSLQVEQSIQSIDPSLALPYMDLAYEANMGEDWRGSEMFTDKWFGSWGTKENDYRVVDSVFAGVEIPTNCSHPETNSYCRLTMSYDNDKSTYLTRSDQACGYRTTGTLTSCSLIAEVLEQSSYVDFNNMISSNIHKYIHCQMGGMWGCPFEIGEAAKLAPDSAALQLFLEGDAAMLGTSAMGQMVGYSLLECPESCGEEVPFEECLCYCPDIHRLVSQGSSLYEASLFVLTESDLMGDDFDGAMADLPTDAAREALVIWYAGFLCSPGRLPPFSSPLGASMDPLFAPTHTYFDYLVQAKMVIDTDFEVNWDNDRLCWGHAFLAHLPWHDFMDEHNAYYTNQELQRFFRPNNPSLPYVYDDFSFDHCELFGRKDS